MNPAAAVGDGIDAHWHDFAAWEGVGELWCGASLVHRDSQDDPLARQFLDWLRGELQA